MSADTKTFSESWYRIADRRVALRPHIEVRRQVYRGERSYVLRDPFTNAFFRLRPAAYQFVARLRMDRTVDAVWRECLEADPDQAPGQDQALRLIAQLHASNLLQSNIPPDSARLFERFQSRQRRETQAKLTNILFTRFPLLNPDPFLQKLLPVLLAVISPLGALVWGIVVMWALKTLIDNAGEFAVQSQAALSPGNLPWLVLALAGVKIFHEFGHAAVCRRLGGEVPTLGIMLMVFTPVPFVDTTSSWAFHSRWHRAFVGAAGMIAEGFIAAIAVLIWANTGAGTLHSIAYNVILVATVSTLLFNINPLLRFDGYYIFSDLLEIPNLQGRSAQQVKHLTQRRLFGIKQSRSPASTTSEAFWLSTYGLLSQIYRLFLSFSILLFLSSAYLLLGLILAVIAAVTWIFVPIIKMVVYLLFSPQLAKTRGRAIAVCCGVIGGVLALLQWVPAPHNFRAPGVLRAAADSMISTNATGQVTEIFVQSGQRVAKGQPLVRMVNPELDWDLVATEAQLTEARLRRDQALEDGAADLEPIDSRIAAIEKQLRRLREDAEALTVRAPHDGVWVAADVSQLKGTWLQRGVELGQVVDLNELHFAAVISQDEASRLFADQIRSAVVRLHGLTERDLPVSTIKAIPAEQDKLPSAALGWSAGGDVATVTEDREGVLVRDPFFEVRSTIALEETTAELRHGISGRIRFELPPEPLLPQWTRKLRQLLQRRGVGG